MFDIRDYYYSKDGNSGSIDHDIINIDDDISDDINSLLNSRFDRLYSIDKYKYFNKTIEIIYPRIQYTRNNSLITNADKIRYLLSFYPQKDDLKKIDKIVLRPRFIEVGQIELVALYLRKKKVLVFYLFHPHFYNLSSSHFELSEEKSAMDIEKILQNKLLDDTVQKDSAADILVHPLWYTLSVISDNEDDMIDKFFIKKTNINDKMYEILNEISFYYSRYGY